MKLLGTVLTVFVVLLISEAWWRRRKLHGELSRKFVHITVGSFVAFWPYYLSVDDIKLLSFAFIIMAMASKYLHIFRAIHSVQRPTWGEFWFALVVGLLAFTTAQHPHIYTAALLEMSLADGLAAVIGSHFGNHHRYSVLGSPKSIIGTSTFLITSFAILGGYAAVSANLSPVLLIVPIACGATFLENVGALGLDNLLVPLFTAGTLLLFS